AGKRESDTPAHYGTHAAHLTLSIPLYFNNIKDLLAGVRGNRTPGKLEKGIGPGSYHSTNAFQRILRVKTRKNALKLDET
ncbi:MAG: hypothetical protein JTJ23_12995, partial [Fusicatenibacter saccharivorans]|nr:hypothetical protein [Fusicatenibacter saccharivorans]